MVSFPMTLSLTILGMITILLIINLFIFDLNMLNVSEIYNLTTMPVFIYLVVFATALNFLLYNFALSRIPVAWVSFYSIFIPPLGVIFSYFILNDGTVKGIGYFDYGLTGDGATNRDYDSPTTLSGATNVIDLSLSESHAAIVLSDGTVKTTGNNTNGQLGHGNNTSLTSWTTVSGLSNIVKVHLISGISEFNAILLPKLLTYSFNS